VPGFIPGALARECPKEQKVWSCVATRQGVIGARSRVWVEMSWCCPRGDTSIHGKHKLWSHAGCHDSTVAGPRSEREQVEVTA